LCTFHNFFDISSKKEDVYFHILYILKKIGKKKSSPIICF
jgi:hypothetical protein